MLPVFRQGIVGDIFSIYNNLKDNCKHRKETTALQVGDCRECRSPTYFRQDIAGDIFSICNNLQDNCNHRKEPAALEVRVQVCGFMSP